MPEFANIGYLQSTRIRGMVNMALGILPDKKRVAGFL